MSEIFRPNKKKKLEMQWLTFSHFIARLVAFEYGAESEPFFLFEKCLQNHISKNKIHSNHLYSVRAPVQNSIQAAFFPRNIDWYELLLRIIWILIVIYTSINSEWFSRSCRFIIISFRTNLFRAQCIYLQYIIHYILLAFWRAFRKSIAYIIIMRIHQAAYTF